MEDCIFCKIIAREIPTDFVYEDDDVVAFNDNNPKSAVHILVVPKKHVASIATEFSLDPRLVSSLIFTAKRIASERGIRDYRLVFNNGKYLEVPHLHLHLMS